MSLMLEDVLPFDRHIHLDFENPCALCIELGPRCFTTTANIIDKGEQTCIERVKGKKTKCPNDRLGLQPSKPLPRLAPAIRRKHRKSESSGSPQPAKVIKKVGKKARLAGKLSGGAMAVHATFRSALYTSNLAFKK